MSFEVAAGNTEKYIFFRSILNKWMLKCVNPDVVRNIVVTHNNLSLSEMHCLSIFNYFFWIDASKKNSFVLLDYSYWFWVEMRMRKSANNNAKRWSMVQTWRIHVNQIMTSNKDALLQIV